MTIDYRDSHQDPGKGQSYHRQFTNNPYRSLIWEIEQKVLSRIVQKNLRDRDVRHLDFACGTGRILEYLQNDVDTSVGVDVSESMLNVARKRLTNCEIINADISKSDALNGRKFELVTAFRFFPNAQDDLRTDVLRRIVSHLSDDGVLVFNNHKNYTSTVFSLGRLIGRKDLHAMKSDEVEDLVNFAGLEIVDAYHIGAIPATDRYLFVPIWLLRPAENFFSRFKIFEKLSFNIIYVCKRRLQIKQEEKSEIQ